MDAKRLEELLDLLMERTSSGSLEWTSQAEDRFILPLGSGTESLSSSPTVLTLNTGTFAATTAGTYSTEPAFRLVVFKFERSPSCGASIREQASPVQGRFVVRGSQRANPWGRRSDLRRPSGTPRRCSQGAPGSSKFLTHGPSRPGAGRRLSSRCRAWRWCVSRSLFCGTSRGRAPSPSRC